MCSQRSSKQRIRLNLPISAFYPHFSVLSPFQCFIPISAFYPHFSVLSPFQRFIPISAFYPHFSVLSQFQRFIPISAFQRFIPISVSAFSFRFRDSVSAFYPYPNFEVNFCKLSDKTCHMFVFARSRQVFRHARAIRKQRRKVTISHSFHTTLEQNRLKIFTSLLP